MADHTPVLVDNKQTGAKVYEWRAADGTNTIVPGTDTISGYIPTGSAREVHIHVFENSASVFVCNMQGTLDPDASDWVNLTDALSNTAIAITDADDLVEVLQGALYMKPVLSTSTSGDITIRVIVKG